MIQLNSKTAGEYKALQLIEQNFLCKLCGDPLDQSDPLSIHLDHDHVTGHCRGVLHRACNTLEGTLLHKFRRSGLKSEHDYIEWLKKLIVYLETDSSKNPLHPGHINTAVKKFKGLGKKDQESELVLAGIDFPSKSTKEAYVKMYRKHLMKQTRK